VALPPDRHEPSDTVTGIDATSAPTNGSAAIAHLAAAHPAVHSPVTPPVLVPRPLTVEVRAPGAESLLLHIRSSVDGVVRTHPFTSRGAPLDDEGRSGWWRATATAHGGDHYWITVDDGPALVDPSAEALTFVDGRPVGVVRARPWPRRPQLGRGVAHPVVYELHVRGFGRTFGGVRERLPYLAELGIDVIELLPVHPFDTSDNYWGYMPIVWGAVHEQYADGDDPAEELADLVAAAHEHGIEVWLDVVFNHTGEGDPSAPTWTLRGLDPTAYRTDQDGNPIDDSGCGNDADPAHPWVRELVLEALGRYADLGVDGFRFDLASILTRDGGELVRRIGDWAERRGVRLVAEAWDLAAYQVGPWFPDRRWAQWNDRFRDDVRGFVRGEPGLVPAMAQRVQGSPELFEGEAWRSVNFVDAHDGLCMHDLTMVTDNRHRAWDCGPELRLQQLKNFFTHLLLSAGAAMFVQGDEFARTQRGYDNPYDVDGPISWVDWSRLDEWQPLYDHVHHLLRLRTLLDHDDVRVYGVAGGPDYGYESRSIAWRSGDVYVMANAWWEPLEFQVVEMGSWRMEVATSPDTVRRDDGTVVVAPRSMVVLLADRT
jgi:glycogen operon protein